MPSKDVPFISHDPQFAARAAQLLRLGIIPGDAAGSTPAATLPAGSLTVCDLRAHVRHYLDDMARRNKPATIAAKGDALGQNFLLRVSSSKIKIQKPQKTLIEPF